MGRKIDILALTESQIREMATTMDCKSLPQEVLDYLGLMEKARDWHYQMKSRLYCVRNLQVAYYAKFKEELSDFRARQIYDDSMNYFYSDRDIRKESWRNMLAERYFTGAQICYDKNDMDGYRRFLNDVERIKKLSENDDEGVDPRLLDRRTFVYIISGKDLGIPEVDRNELARMIDGYDIKESMKVKIKREAGSLPRKLFEREGDVEDVQEIK